MDMYLQKKKVITKRQLFILNRHELSEIKITFPPPEKHTEEHPWPILKSYEIHSQVLCFRE